MEAGRPRQADEGGVMAKLTRGTPSKTPRITARPEAVLTGDGVKEWPTTVRFADMADNPDNPRETLRDLEGLASTIKDRGILQDLVLVPRENWLTAHPEHAKPVKDGGIGDKPFVILIGHRRRHAGELAGLVEGPVKVREDAAGTSRQDALIENVQRDDLSPMEEAHAIRDLMEEESLSQGRVAAVLGKSPGWVSQRLALLGLRPELQQALAAGALRVEDARRLGKLPHEQQVWPEPVPDPPAPVPVPPAGGGAAAGGGVAPQRQESAPKPRSRVDDDHLDEAMRVESAVVQVITQAGNLRALKRIADDQPAIGRRILDGMDEAIRKLTAAANELRTDLEGRVGG
jgi:ParB/RepB/Spo0J family partition protein